jgi:hypothetical protein
MWSVWLEPFEKKVPQLGINFPPKQALQLVQWCFPSDYLIKTKYQAVKRGNENP